MEISNFKYRKATLNFVVKGWGTTGIVYLDGSIVQSIPSNLQGEHLVEIVMSVHTDIANVPSVAKLDLYPNPSKDVIHLSHAERCKSFSIYDIQGRLIKMIADAKVDINVADLEVGVYLIKGVGFDGEQVFRRFLKI